MSTIEAGNVAMTNVSFTGCESEGVRAASTHGHPAPTPSIHALATQKGNDGARGVILLGRPDPTLTPFYGVEHPASCDEERGATRMGEAACLE